MNNLITRTVSGIFFVAVMVGAILYDAKTFIVLFGIITALAVWEFCTLVNNKRELQVNRLISTAAGLYLYLAMMAFCTGASGAAIFIPYLITLMYLLISGLYMRSPRSLENWVFAFASQLYIALPFALMNVLAFRMQSGVDGMSGLAYIPALPLGLMIFLWTNDMGAYCFGSMLQRFVPFKLFPSVSPHKSWIGSIGGGLVTCRYNVALLYVHASCAMGGHGARGSGVRHVGRPGRKPFEAQPRGKGQRPLPARTWRSARPFRQLAAGHPGRSVVFVHTRNNVNSQPFAPSKSAPGNIHGRRLFQAVFFVRFFAPDFKRVFRGGKICLRYFKICQTYF